MSKDAWKDTGWCGECRRQPYCSTQCRACKVRLARLRVELRKYLKEKRAAKEKEGGRQDEQPGDK